MNNNIGSSLALAMPAAERHSFSQVERVIYWTAVLTPLWWLLGVQPLLYPAVMVGLLLWHFDIQKIVRSPFPICIWAWLLMALVMLWTAFLGLFDMGAGLKTIAAALVTFFKSYLLIFSCLALPFLTSVRVDVVTRSVSWMSIGFLVNMLVQLVLLPLGVNDFQYKPILARLIPGDVSSSLLVNSAWMSDFFNVSLPRSVLHTADPPILGICALLCFLICLSEKQKKLRQWAVFSSGCALLISFSRLSWLCFILAIAALICFRYQRIRHIPLWLSALTFLLCSVLELSFQELLQKPQEFFDSARSSSSLERALVVLRTIEAWQEKPWLGWGIIRGKAWLYEDVYVTLGSFSTYAAVLYLNGIVGFIFFMAALVLTLLAFYQPAFRGDFNCQVAFVGFSLLCILIQASPLSWMSIYIWFFFLWLGAVLRDVMFNPELRLNANWDQLVTQPEPAKSSRLFYR